MSLTAKTLIPLAVASFILYLTIIFSDETKFHVTKQRFRARYALYKDNVKVGREFDSLIERLVKASTNEKVQVFAHSHFLLPILNSADVGVLLENPDTAREFATVEPTLRLIELPEIDSLVVHLDEMQTSYITELETGVLTSIIEELNDMLIPYMERSGFLRVYEIGQTKTGRVFTSVHIVVPYGRGSWIYGPFPISSQQSAITPSSNHEHLENISVLLRASSYILCYNRQFDAHRSYFNSFWLHGTHRRFINFSVQISHLIIHVKVNGQCFIGNEMVQDLSLIHI
eukprot:TRINITY_DN1886_c0_g1_i5.p1 TRINITY_DN1886_c0_g1~~TRINITY_DN1886_c0_g1_i5.p1  ORF type:complete len:286 (-),score=6.73 TRINITY_DN1886_c0_g1_i5:61-918(-)